MGTPSLQSAMRAELARPFNFEAALASPAMQQTQHPHQLARAHLGPPGPRPLLLATPVPRGRVRRLAPPGPRPLLLATPVPRPPLLAPNGWRHQRRPGFGHSRSKAVRVSQAIWPKPARKANWPTARNFLTRGGNPCAGVPCAVIIRAPELLSYEFSSAAN